MEQLNRWLYRISFGLGVIEIVYGIWRFYANRIAPALLASLAVVIAGPLEDILDALVRRRRKIPPEEPAITLVDQATSIGLLVCLIIAIYLM